MFCPPFWITLIWGKLGLVGEKRARNAKKIFEEDLSLKWQNEGYTIHTKKGFACKRKKDFCRENSCWMQVDGNLSVDLSVVLFSCLSVCLFVHFSVYFHFRLSFLKVSRLFSSLETKYVHVNYAKFKSA